MVMSSAMAAASRWLARRMTAAARGDLAEFISNILGQRLTKLQQVPAVVEDRELAHAVGEIFRRITHACLVLPGVPKRIDIIRAEIKRAGERGRLRVIVRIRRGEHQLRTVAMQRGPAPIV